MTNLRQRRRENRPSFRLRWLMWVVVVGQILPACRLWRSSWTRGVANVRPSAKDSRFATFTTATNPSAAETRPTVIHRTLQVQIVHRHGDRTPITPLQDEDFWARTLVDPLVLEQMGSATRIVREEAYRHQAGGRGPFGKLTQLGMLQMIQLGSKLRQQLATDQLDAKIVTTTSGNTSVITYPYVWTPQRPLHPSNLRVMSTDFARTIQSVQALLIGLFPGGTLKTSASAEPSAVVEIDVRHTNGMIPDPQPRQSVEQEELERALARRPHVLQREAAMRPLALRTTLALQPLLATDARQVSFGVVQESASTISASNSEEIIIEPLSWNQLSEITKCLSVRSLLPAELTLEEVEAVTEHAAWRWFQSLSHPRLAYLSMHSLVSRQVLEFMQPHLLLTTSPHPPLDHPSEHHHPQHDHLRHHATAGEGHVMSEDDDDDDNASSSHRPPPVVIWSAHDSTLMGLMCAYRLEQPEVWPEYGSYLMLELIQVEKEEEEEVADHHHHHQGSPGGWKKELHVRFSLNGQVLRSQWEEPAQDMISLRVLVDQIQSMDRTTAAATA